MKHPFEALAPEYDSWVAHAEIRPECVGLVDSVAHRLIRLWDAGHYKRVAAISGVPVLFEAPSFEREASSDFDRSPAQGDRWDRVSVNVPRGVGPFASWDAAAIWSYHHDALDLVGIGNWTWAALCYWSELFNGFGYRDFHRIRSPYVVGGTTLQQRGKYTSDGHYDPNTMDSQLGTLAMQIRMAQLRPELLNELQLAGAHPGVPATAPEPNVIPFPSPIRTENVNVEWLQDALNRVQPAELNVDGNYGKKTRAAVLVFQRAHPPLDVDGFAGTHMVAVLSALLKEDHPALQALAA